MGESSVAAAQFPEDRALLARFACAASRLTAPAERSRPMWVAIPFATGSDDPFSEPDAGLRAPACLAFDKGAETVAKLGAERGHADAIAIELRGICRFLQFDDEEIRPGSTAAMDDHIGHDSGVTLAVAPPRAVIRKRYGLDDAIDMVLLSDCGIAFLLRASHPRQFATRGSTLIVQRRSKSGQSPAPQYLASGPGSWPPHAFNEPCGFMGYRSIALYLVCIRDPSPVRTAHRFGHAPKPSAAISRRSGPV